MRLKRPRKDVDRVPPLASLVQALMTDSDAGVLLVTPQGRVHALNTVAGGMIGRSVPRAGGAPAADLLRTVVAGDEPARDAFRRASTERDVVLATRSGGEVPALLRSVRLGRPVW